MQRDPIDPTGLIRESYRIEGITAPECRTIFFEWALGVAVDMDTSAAINVLLERYSDAPQDHPMTQTLKAALAQSHPPRRKGGRRARVPD